MTTKPNLPAKTQPASLPDLVRRAASSLASAETAAEILDARQLARLARDVLKREASMLKAKSAHGDVIAAVRRSQGDALEIEALADKRLADEYDAAQERGEVASVGQPSIVPAGNDKPATAAEIGLSRKDIHEARQIRDAEKVEPGIVRRVLEEKLAAGEEPTRAALRAGIAAAIGKGGAPKPQARDYGGITADQRVDELEEHVAALEADIRGYVAELKSYREMKALFEKGGFEAVVAAKDELIRSMETRNYAEGAAKADWMGKAKFWEKEAKRLGWRNMRTDGAPSDVPSDYDEAFFAATRAEG